MNQSEIRGHHIKLTTVPLADLPARAIAPLLREQAAEWRHTLLWDFTRIARHTQLLADLRVLSGVLLLDESDSPVGYALCHPTGQKGDCSDFYVHHSIRNRAANTLLMSGALLQLEPLLDSLEFTPALTHGIDVDSLPIRPTSITGTAAESASVAHISARARPNASHSIAIRAWHSGDEEEAAAISADFYASPEAGTRCELEVIIGIQATFPFLPEASVMAVNQETGRICGFLVATQAMEGVAYANFLFVARRAAGHNLGDRLSIAVCQALERLGYHTVTLRRRLDPKLARFYARMGFTTQVELTSYQWRRQTGGLSTARV